MYACFMKNGTFDNTLMFLASPQLRYEMSQIHIEHPVVIHFWTQWMYFRLSKFVAKNVVLDNTTTPYDFKKNKKKLRKLLIGKFNSNISSVVIDYCFIVYILIVSRELLLFPSLSKHCHNRQSNNHPPILP